MWRPILMLMLLAGLLTLTQAPPVEAQLASPSGAELSPPGICQTFPCQGAGAVACLANPSSPICSVSFTGCIVACACSPAASLGSLVPTGVAVSAAQGVRYATYSDGGVRLPPMLGPNLPLSIADAVVPYSSCNGFLAPVVGIPGSFGYNVGPRRGFNPYATQDAYRQTLDAVVAPSGGGYLLSWTSGTSFSTSSHEVFQCPESDTPLMACRSVGVVNAETRTFGPVPGGYTYIVRTQGYGGYTGTISWGSSLEAGSSRLPLPLVPPPSRGGAE